MEVVCFISRHISIVSRESEQSCGLEREGPSFQRKIQWNSIVPKVEVAIQQKKSFSNREEQRGMGCTLQLSIQTDTWYLLQSLHGSTYIPPITWLYPIIFLLIWAVVRTVACCLSVVTFSSRDRHVSVVSEIISHSRSSSCFRSYSCSLFSLVIFCHACSAPSASVQMIPSWRE